jgi:hypothetical protein
MYTVTSPIQHMLPIVNKYKDLIWYSGKATYYNPKNHRSALIDMYCWTLFLFTLFTVSSFNNRMKKLYPKNHRSALIDTRKWTLFTVSSFNNRMKKMYVLLWANFKGEGGNAQMHCNFSPYVPKPLSKSYYACISQTDISGAATDTIFPFFSKWIRASPHNNRVVFL